MPGAMTLVNKCMSCGALHVLMRRALMKLPPPPRKRVTTNPKLDPVRLRRLVLPAKAHVIKPLCERGLDHLKIG